MTPEARLMQRLAPDLQTMAARFAYSESGAVVDEHDLAQEGAIAILCAWRDRRRLYGRLGWMLQRARWRMRDALKAEHAMQMRGRVQRRERHVVPLSDEHDLFGFDPSHLIETRVDVERLIARLPAGLREVAILRFIQDRTLADVARLTGCRVSTAGKRSQRALELLRELSVTRRVA